MNVLGIESTAHTFGIGIVNEEEILANQKDMYEPEEGGIHPRKASEHHYGNAVHLLKQAYEEAELESEDIDAIAYSRGPGIPQCLEVGAVTARSLAQKHDIPLIGVNHCLAHISIGTRTTEAEKPTTLYVSGGNTQIIQYRNDKYRIVGETLDVALGNALDKLARTLGHPHPGGPEIEKLAEETDEIIVLSYTIKGMDLSYSGLVTESQRKAGGASEEVISNSFQEHAYSAAIEALERAIAQEDSKEALLTGGVAMNSRLQEMITQMCDQRGAEAYVPPPEFLMDNGVMIAHQGLIELQAGRETDISAETLPNWRPDEVNTSWM